MQTIEKQNGVFAVAWNYNLIESKKYIFSNEKERDFLIYI